MRREEEENEEKEQMFLPVWKVIWWQVRRDGPCGEIAQSSTSQKMEREKQTSHIKILSIQEKKEKEEEEKEKIMKRQQSWETEQQRTASQIQNLQWLHHLLPLLRFLLLHGAGEEGRTPITILDASRTSDLGGSPRSLGRSAAVLW